MTRQGSLRRSSFRQFAHAGIDLHDDVGGIAPTLSFEVERKVGQFGAEPVKCGRHEKDVGVCSHGGSEGG